MHTAGVEYKEILNIHVDYFGTEYIEDFCFKKRSKNGAINFPFLFLVIMYGLELGIQNLELWNTSNSTAKLLMFLLHSSTFRFPAFLNHIRL
jgi:hypothetical protein